MSPAFQAVSQTRRGRAVPSATETALLTQTWAAQTAWSFAADQVKVSGGRPLFNGVHQSEA